MKIYPDTVAKLAAESTTNSSRCKAYRSILIASSHGLPADTGLAGCGEETARHAEHTQGSTHTVHVIHIKTHVNCVTHSGRLLDVTNTFLKTASQHILKIEIN